ncbi:hypothetical protein JOF56_003383 [Kibdelosporangium banguiense]|uniref:Uncharacterized protein n=1 Tax=Kibdelosporangium banguiense TaxID=1365924 RepID=A0ABS4TEY9_9PSEU|nr:hypothetical protein [Kibdelosporangium banguiense]MBP2322998.1 hypothetical protein [Kibdelosporangium banguiense]
MRLRSLLISIITVLLGITVSVPAQASIGDVWAFAYNDKPAPGPVFGLMDPSHQWTPTGPASEVRSYGTGRYEVRFAKTANKVGIPHVTAVNPKPHYCQLVGWKPSFSTGYEHVWVDCYAFGGVPADSRFTVMFTGSSGFSPFGTDKHAYIHSAYDGTILDEYNSEGLANYVGWGGPGTGEWKVWLPMSGPPDESGNFQATAVNDKPARCKISEWYPGASGQTVVVRCYDYNSKPFDTGWTLSYNRERPVVGAIGPPKLFGYVWVNPALPSQTNYNSLGAVNTVFFGPGQYLVTFPKVGMLEDHVQVTAFGKGSEHCGLEDLWGTSGGNAVVRNVNCFDEFGKRAKSDSFVAYTSRN